MGSPFGKESVDPHLWDMQIGTAHRAYKTRVRCREDCRDGWASRSTLFWRCLRPTLFWRESMRAVIDWFIFRNVKTAEGVFVRMFVWVVMFFVGVIGSTLILKPVVDYLVS